MGEQSATLYDRLAGAIESGITAVFKPILLPVFAPINKFLAMFYMPWATICAVGLFVGAMVWVYTLKKEYVNLDAPSKSLLYDLRLWTILSMIPHVIVYFYFTGGGK